MSGAAVTGTVTFASFGTGSPRASLTARRVAEMYCSMNAGEVLFALAMLLKPSTSISLGNACRGSISTPSNSLMEAA